MKILFAGLLVFISMVTGMASQVQANRVLYVAPTRIVLEPGKQTDTMTIMNQSEKKRTYNISLINSVMTEKGSSKRVDTFPYAAKRMLRYVPRSVELEPGQRQTVRIMVRRPRDLEDGDYHSHILFRERPVKIDKPEQKEEGFSVHLGAQYGLAVPIIVQHGNVNSTVRVEGVDKEATTDKKLVVTFSREGNAEGQGFVRIYRKTPEGLVKLTNNKTLRMYREVDQVSRTFNVVDGEKFQGDVLIRMHKNKREDSPVLQEVAVSL